jgi:hypothetical protein
LSQATKNIPAAAALLSTIPDACGKNFSRAAIRNAKEANATLFSATRLTLLTFVGRIDPNHGAK